MNKYIKKISWIRSFRFRIFVVMLLVGIISSIVMRISILDDYEDRAVSVKIAEVENQFKIIANHLLTYNYLQDTTSEVINAELNQLSNLYDGRVLIVNQSFKVVKDTYGISEGKTIISEEVIRCFKGESIAYYDKENELIEHTIPIVQSGLVASDKETAVQGVMLTSVSTSSIDLIRNIMEEKSIILEMLIIIVLFGLAIVISYALVAPFYKVSNAIAEVKDGYIEEQISVTDYAETEKILDAFNQVLARMSVLDQSRQEFVSNVSHELKTPLTSMKVLADALVQQSDAPLEMYQEFMIDIAQEIERENKIINDLLSLVKLDKSSADLNITNVSVNELMEALLKRLRPIARKADVEIVFESIRPIMAEIDEMKLSLAFTNLVENAIKYNREHGQVKVVLDADHQFLYVEVIDTGMGIPEEAYEHIYERFYRVDKSHSREIGGTGLGLSITRNIILMHRGSIKVASVMEEGTTFTVKIPLIYVG